MLSTTCSALNNSEMQADTHGNKPSRSRLQWTKLASLKPLDLTAVPGGCCTEVIAVREVPAEGLSYLERPAVADMKCFPMRSRHPYSVRSRKSRPSQITPAESPNELPMVDTLLSSFNIHNAPLTEDDLRAAQDPDLFSRPSRLQSAERQARHVCRRPAGLARPSEWEGLSEPKSRGCSLRELSSV